MLSLRDLVHLVRKRSYQREPQMLVVQLYDGEKMTITHAKTGESFVIQGCLGTGKQIKLVFLQFSEATLQFRSPQGD